jgi:hypothetical protein
MRLSRRRLVLSAAALAPLTLAGAAPAVAQPLGLERPRTAIALLQNMKRAAGEGALLDETFYAEANLKESFGAQQVAYGRPIPGYRLYGRVSGFGVLFEVARVGGDYREGGDFSFSLSSADATPVEGMLRLSFLRPTLGFDDVEKVFGRDWKPAAYPAAPGAAPPHAERVHGGTAMLYPLGSGDSSRWIMFAFNPRALLELAVAAGR